MATVAQPEVAEPNVPSPKLELVETDGVPLESPWHHAAISLLIASLTCWWRERTDFYVGGNMFLYFSEEQARNKDYRGPDFFCVKGVNRFPPRPYWAVWLEGGRYPNYIIELLSPTTAKLDRTTKKELYAQTFHTPEYVCFDPDKNRLQGWRLGRQHRYRAIRLDERGWLWSEELGLWLGPWKGSYLGIEATWPRFYDASGSLVRIDAELEQDRAETERQRAETERKRAETERKRAEAAEAEVARLQAQLAELQQRHPE
jgi:Uma2 family endonuclease